MLKRIVAVIVLDLAILFAPPAVSAFATGLSLVLAANLIFGKA